MDQQTKTLLIETLEAQKQKLDQAIAELKGKPANTTKRTLSASARKKISEAQKARWAKAKSKK